ncbi:PAQR family membrane homeostasis protein TrhA [Lactiplantibacillus modestisalitolerans]|uniref:Hemolysin III family protein n=1 Tax=Lactiplantibacillus modestisalitolerans TaxID=1457219 RepID=A0ABV5WW75_9LACO|nr:hemolysin III family protein [Lactiplantibacillus modestisalitolerans]
MDDFLNKYVLPYTDKYIGRAKENKYGLPLYTTAEEKLNTISHALGVLIGIGAIVATLTLPYSEFGKVSGLIFGISLILLYAISATYHGIPMLFVKWKKRFRIMDHCSIFILIAGTGTPLILRLIAKTADPLEWIFYFLIWVLAVGGVALLCINMKKYKAVTTVMYVIMGSMLAIRSSDLVHFIGSTGISLLLIGGVFYAIGLLFYGLGTRKKWMHAVFHILCLVGSVIHCVCIFGFVLV